MSLNAYLQQLTCSRKKAYDLVLKGGNGFVFRLRPAAPSGPLGGVLAALRLTCWTGYILVVAGATGIVIGAINRSWKMCLCGLLAMVIGFVVLRAWHYMRDHLEHRGEGWR